MTEKPGTEDKTTISTPSATSPNVDMKVRRFSYFWIRKKTRFQNDLAFTVNNIFNVLSYKLRGWNFTIAKGELANKDRIIWKLLVTSALLSFVVPLVLANRHLSSCLSFLLSDKYQQKAYS